MTAEPSTPPLIRAMLEPAFYDHPAARPRLIETHISWVILAGDYAYKLKKPVDLGFLDFSTLEKRRFYCAEELRLNRRLAPSIYLDLVRISGPASAPRLNGEGEAIEFAVKMKQFPQTAQLDRMLDSGKLRAEHIDAMADFIAGFHLKAEASDPRTDYGEPAQVHAPVAENFRQIRERITGSEHAKTLDDLEQWSEAEFRRLLPVFKQRKTNGWIRECHGDLHLRNLAWVDHKPLAFDCIEFNPELRWIDVISDIAFLVMDLEDRGQPSFAWRLLNRYLERTGDYAGIATLRFYLVYRALVRAKVDAIRCAQPGISERERREAGEDFSAYLKLAQRHARTGDAALIITHGLSGSGKSTLSQPLLERLGAIRLRSDVERKRLFGFRATESAQAAPDAGIYSAEKTDQTYTRLAELAAGLLDAGYPVIVDATFQKPEQRARFRKLAAEKQQPWIILDFTASPDTLRRRIARRQDDASDANLQVLEQQLQHWRPLAQEEEQFAIRIDSEAPFDADAVAEQIRARYQPGN